MWSKRENRLRVSMLNNHPALIELRNSLRKSHQGHVYENRLNILSNSAPLEYNPPKGSKLCSKDNQSFTVLLSTDRKSLVIRDINQTIREIWPLNCVIRVSLGIMEKVKKNPERYHFRELFNLVCFLLKQTNKPTQTLLLQLELSDASNQDDLNESLTNKSRFLRVSLLARSIIEYNYWLDGLFLLNKLNNPSDYYNEDVERLTDLDMRIRLSSLDLNQLPKREIQIPPDPPPLDFI
ncbi:engulfment and cell motility protein 1 [Schistosoma japonicum]|nr:engulfment and cell motility protein 1 [Schistosoma japonicum]KAH8863420.1 engulfment and cell motility protein 1 [Schistosoma japonicum]